MEDGPPFFNQDFSCPDLLLERLHIITFYIRGYHPLSLAFPNHSNKQLCFCIPALSLSLAATQEISFDFFSSRYLDVSVL